MDKGYFSEQKNRKGNMNRAKDSRGHEHYNRTWGSYGKGLWRMKQGPADGQERV